MIFSESVVYLMGYTSKCLKGGKTVNGGKTVPGSSVKGYLGKYYPTC